MNRFAANEPESTFFIDVFKIALGVFIGVASENGKNRTLSRLQRS